MPVLRRLYLCCLALSVAGCIGPNPEFYGAGVGSRLTNVGTLDQLALQQRYFNYLCISALVPSRDINAQCDLPVYDAGTWTAITQQGMNDIDRRCDSYLEWLDDRRRSRAPLTQQVGAMGATTAAIMGIAGSSASAISIVALAFELVSQSLDNYHSRLLLEVDGSTVTSIVMTSQQRFREEFRRQVAANGGVRSKPEAEFMLRQYLRLCMPFVIETQINQFSTLGALGTAPTPSNAISTTPIEPPRAYRPIEARQSIRQAPPRQQVIPEAPADYRQIFSDELIARVGSGLVDDFLDAQRALCISRPSRSVTGHFKQGVALFEDTVINSAVNPGVVVDGKLNEVELDYLIGGGPCEAFQRNFYEKRNILTDDANLVRQLAVFMAEAVPTVSELPSNIKASDPAFRDAIRKSRTFFGLQSEYGGTVADQLDRKFVVTITN